MKIVRTALGISIYTLTFIIALLNLAWAVRSDNATWYLNATVAVVIFTILIYKNGGRKN